jgi:hypothetical protein
MAGIKALRKIQLGRETNAGVAVAATAIWRGLGTIEDTRNEVVVAEDVGTLIPPVRTYTAALGGALAMEAVPATFEQLPHILEAGILAIGTGVADGAGTGKIYDYAFPEATSNAIKTYTIEGGDNEAAEEVEYCYVADFALSGKGGEALTMAANWLGRQVSTSTFTGALAIPTVEEILFSKGALYIDAVAGSYGATIKSSTFLAMDLKVKTGWIPVWTADGGAGNFFGFIKCPKPEIILDITFEHEASSIAEKAAWRAKTPRLIQLKFLGSALTTPGTTYTYRSLIINLAGRWSKFSKLGEQDGNDIVTGTFVAGYDPTKADVGQIIVVNQLATIP